MSSSGWDHTYDAVVVGSGNGALTAAILCHDGGANTLVLEKSDMFGGTSASSGGGVWIPNNRYAREAESQGIVPEGFGPDNVDDARDYIQSMSPEGLIRDEMIETYLTHGPKMIDYLHDYTRWVRYLNLRYYPDYFPHNPGGRGGNRSMEPEPIGGKLLKKNLRRLRPQHPQTHMPGGINFTQVEGQTLLGGLQGWKSMGAKLVLRYLSDLPWRLYSRRDRRLTMGNAGIARLWLSLQDREVPMWSESPVTELLTAADGRVEGVVVKRNGESLRIRATKGVILAAGGFERNQQMRESHLPSPTDSRWSGGNLANTGDLLQAAMDLGAATEQMDWAWWSPAAMVPTEEKARLMMIERSMPGSYTVNQQGQRFTNESQNYIDFVEDIFTQYRSGNPCIPCYMIFDADFRRNRPCNPLIQGKLMPDWMVPRSWWTPDFLTKGNSLRELAEKINIDASGLEDTQRQINAYSADGKDPDFQRGDSVYDRYYGDPEIKPNPCLGKLLKPPFYAMALYPGEMGTAGGLVIDTDGRVLNGEREPIPGLYATGNITAALLPRYPGPGSTLGPAMTFGYLAARHLSGGDA